MLRALLTIALCLGGHLSAGHIGPVRLNEYIGHYEPLSYDSQVVHRNHVRARRSVMRDDAVHLYFNAHGRTFDIHLERDLATFSDRLVLHGPTAKEEDSDTSHIYQGRVAGEPRSHVFGSISDGIFEGTIVAHSGAFYVEKAHRYFPKGENTSFHSVIYSDHDVADPYELVRTGHVGGCGITGDVTRWMDRVRHSGVDDSGGEGRDDHHDKYGREADEEVRAKRSTSTRGINRKTCSLFIRTDPLVWRHVTEQVGNDSEKTREEILSLVAHHVAAVNYIYQDTKFDGRVEHRNIRFEVQRIQIDDDKPCQPDWNGEGNKFCSDNITVSDFLDLHSMDNHEDFCLAYVFTHRDFAGGVLGLAWDASPSGRPSGGICEKYKTYTETVGGNYQSTRRSLNTGIITFVNYNSRVPPRVSQLTLAHQIGHNFGSPHDYPAECRPGGLNGNFIMFPSATGGDRPNNSKFSSCSIGNISNVLDAIEDNRRRNCFTASAGSFCGNKIVEAGEECDCGYDDIECSENCCYPRQVSETDRLRNSSARGCDRKRDTQCSPSQGPCCSSDTCHFVPESHVMQCRGESDCSWLSSCDGRSPECPVPLPKSNRRRCNEGTQLCIAGECTGSICLEWNMTECFLTSHTDVDERKQCDLACRNGTSACRSTSEFAHQVGLAPGGISLRPGSPCNDFQGYCDDFNKCRPVGDEEPLARLKNKLNTERT